MSGHAGRLEDKAEALSRASGSSWGLDRTNRELAEGLVNALHCRVKWGNRPEDAVNLAVILLRVSVLILNNRAWFTGYALSYLERGFNNYYRLGKPCEACT